MSDPLDTRDAADTRIDPQLAARLGALGPSAAAPPAPPAILGLVRRRRRARRAMQVGSAVLLIALAATVALRLAPAPAPAPTDAVDAAPRWVHLADPNLPSALHLRNTWLRTGDLPAGPPTTRPVSAPMRPLDALQLAEPLG